MNVIKSIIVDDEMWGIQVLEILSSKTKKIEVIKTFQNPVEALEWVKLNDVDLIFLDIQMPEMNGFEFVKLLNGRAKVIITTANEKYALKFDKDDILGYLLKPISLEEFLKSISWYEEN